MPCSAAYVVQCGSSPTARDSLAKKSDAAEHTEYLDGAHTIYLPNLERRHTNYGEHSVTYEGGITRGAE